MPINVYLPIVLRENQYIIRPQPQIMSMMQVSRNSHFSTVGSFLGIPHLLLQLRLPLELHAFNQFVQLRPRLWILWNVQNFPPFHDPLLKDPWLVEEPEAADREHHVDGHLERLQLP